jgi:2-oxo-4-hydroxy-4-carboxy-5-ureidoimidazoline decarboxylase
MLRILESRIGNSPEQELPIAAGEQSKITKIRLEKLLQE